MLDLAPLTTVTPADAALIARDLTRDEALPPGFDLPEFIEELGGSVRYSAKTAGLTVDPGGTFVVRVAQPPIHAGRENAAELFGLFLFLGVTGVLSGPAADRPVQFPWSKRTPDLQKTAATFARELLVPGDALIHLVDFYALGGSPEARRDADVPKPAARKGWRRRDLDFLAGLFEVTAACMEIRLVEEGLLRPKAL